MANSLVPEYIFREVTLEQWWTVDIGGGLNNYKRSMLLVE